MDHIQDAFARYCVVRKADIPNRRVHAVASYVRFHSRDNRLKGDTPQPSSLRDAGGGFCASGEFGMLSRALILATVMLLIGGFAADRALAQAKISKPAKALPRFSRAPATPVTRARAACSRRYRQARCRASCASTTPPAAIWPGCSAPFWFPMARPIRATLAASPSRARTASGGEASSDQLDRFGRRQRPAGSPQEEAAKPDPQQAASERGPDGRKFARQGRS